MQPQKPELTFAPRLPGRDDALRDLDARLGQLDTDTAALEVDVAAVLGDADTLRRDVAAALARVELVEQFVATGDELALQRAAHPDPRDIRM